MTSNSRVAENNPEAVNNVSLSGQEFYFPCGLLGFPSSRRYRLERFDRDASDVSPFLILNSLDQDLSFPVVHPDSIALEYPLPITAELLNAVRARSETELVPLLIVTVRERLDDTTLNLQGPLILNPTSSLGLQWVVEQYPLRFPLANANV